MSVVTGAFNITAIIDGVNGTNGVAYGIRTNVESWHVNSDGLSPNALTWSFVVSDGTTTKVISSLVDCYAAGLSPKCKLDEGEITTAPSSFRLKLYSYYKSVTIYLYKGDDIVAEKTIRASYGVLSVIQQYYLSSSNTELIGGAWSATRPTSTLGMYLWVRTLTTYTDGSYSTSEPLLWNNNIVAINKLISGDVEVQSDVYKVAEYVPLAPLVEGRKYRITLCATFAAETTLVELSLSRGYKVFASFNPYPVEEGEEDVEIVPTQQVFSFEFECDYLGGLTPDMNIEYANVRVSQNVTGYVSIIHWAQIEVGLVSETKMYALSTDRMIAPTGNWSTTMPVSVVGTYVWEKRVQVYDDGTQAEVGFLCLQGASGAKMRMRDWATKTDYLQGMSGEEYYDIVLYGGRLYLCTLSHKSSSAILPTNTVYWQIAQDWQFVATELMLARKIKADEIDANGITAKDVIIQGSIRSPWKSLSYVTIYRSASGDVMGFNGSAINDDNIIVGGYPGSELLIAWGDNANGREINIFNSVSMRGAAVKIIVADGCSIVDNGVIYESGSEYVLNPGYLYTMIGFTNMWVIKNKIMVQNIG